MLMRTSQKLSKIDFDSFLLGNAYFFFVDKTGNLGGLLLLKYGFQ